jgi:regulator of protease activity HflC (stomatin/prohibitin superfamily)
MQQQQQ